MGLAVIRPVYNQQNLTLLSEKCGQSQLIYDCSHRTRLLCHLINETIIGKQFFSSISVYFSLIIFVLITDIKVCNNLKGADIFRIFTRSFV